MPLSGTDERVTPVLDFPSRDGLSVQAIRVDHGLARVGSGPGGETQIVVADIRDECLLAFPVPGANAGEAFRHPFRYAQ